jgi:hypothetical protein
LAPETVKTGIWLGSFAQGLFEFRRPVDKSDCNWTMLHAGHDVYRLQCVDQGVAKDLTALRRGGKLSVGLRLPDAVRGHLWFLVPSRTTPGTYSLKSLLDQDKLLAYETGGEIRLLPHSATGGTDWRIES